VPTATATEKLDFTQESNIHNFSTGPKVRSARLASAKVKPADLILFTTQLSVMLDSGVVLSDALDAIAEQTSAQNVFKAIVQDAADMVKNGENFSKALAAYPKAFMLTVLSGYLSFELETRKRIKGALMYPAIMALLGLAAMTLMMFFVLPRFIKIYESRGSALPKLTQILVDVSKLLSDPQSMTLITTAAILTLAGLYYWSRTTPGRRIIDLLKIRIPIVGTMFIDAVITRSMRIMATMVNTGVSLLDAIDVIRGSCTNYYFEQLWASTDEKIRDGYQLSESIQISPGGDMIAPGIIQMIRAGEKSGKLGEVSDKVSVFYEKKLQASIKTTTALIEPLMISVLGGIIGTIAIALLLPVFKISSVITH